MAETWNLRMNHARNIHSASPLSRCIDSGGRAAAPGGGIIDLVIDSALHSEGAKP